MSDFFNAGDGLTTAATLAGVGGLVGYFDITDTSLYADGSEAEEVAQFVCEDWAGSSSTVGSTLTIGSDSYVIQKAQQDGTGLVTLNLIQP